MRNQTIIVIAAFAALGIVFGCAAGGGSTDPITVVKTDSGAVSYAGTIQPILLDHCIRCHGEDRDGKLSILNYDDVMKGGKSGSFVVPGEPDKSRLVNSVEKTVEPFMPPKIFPALTEDRIQAIRQWIEEGAENN